MNGASRNARPHPFLSRNGPAHHPGKSKSLVGEAWAGEASDDGSSNGESWAGESWDKCPRLIVSSFYGSFYLQAASSAARGSTGGTESPCLCYARPPCGSNKCGTPRLTLKRRRSIQQGAMKVAVAAQIHKGIDSFSLVFVRPRRASRAPSSHFLIFDLHSFAVFGQPGGLRVGDHFLGYFIGNEIVMRKLHRVTCASLGHGGQIGGVTQHL